MDIIISRLIDLISAPLNYSNMLWMAVPLIASTIVMQIYFGRYNNEELGWGTAVGNSIILLFVGIDLFRFLSLQGISTASLSKLGLVIFIMGYSIVLAIADFLHFLPKWFSFFISSPLPVNIIAYLGLAVIYASLPLDFITGIAAFALFVVLFILFTILRLIIPNA